MSWFRPVRSLIGRESGRTFVCGARTNLKLKTDSSLGPIVVQICSSCITEGLSPDILWNERDTGKCSLTRIMGENGESFRPGTLSVSVGGIHGAARHAEISKKCEALGQLAEGIFVSENFAVALVTYRSNRCHVYGIGFGDNFPTGSKIKLADLPFDAVDGRFEVERSQPVSLADFDRGLCDQMKMAVDSFITDVDFF